MYYYLIQRGFLNTQLNEDLIGRLHVLRKPTYISMSCDTASSNAKEPVLGIFFVCNFLCEIMASQNVGSRYCITVIFTIKIIDINAVRP